MAEAFLPRLVPGFATELRALPGLLQAQALLPLQHAELSARIERALTENPALRRRAGSPCPSCGRHGRTGRCPRCPSRPGSGGVGRDPPEPTVDPFGDLEVAAGCEIRSDCRPALPAVLAHLTERGLLDATVADIARAHRLTEPAVIEAIRAIRAAGPPGIAQRSVTDLLLAQAAALVAAGRAPAGLVPFVRDHLPAVADGDLDGPGRALGLPAVEIERLLRIVRTQLRPTAGTGRADSRPVPDVLVYRAADGALSVEVADSAWYGLTLASMPAQLRADPAAVAWLRGHEREARELLRQLDSRATVLRRVATAAVGRQSGFLRHGPPAHRDLTRAELAAELALHPSTVSRAVSGKVLRTPDARIIELAALFGTAVPVKARIAELAGTGLSDERLRATLALDGHRLARRTVAKYRAELGIAAAGRRRS